MRLNTLLAVLLATSLAAPAAAQSVDLGNGWSTGNSGTGIQRGWDKFGGKKHHRPPHQGGDNGNADNGGWYTGNNSYVPSNNTQNWGNTGNGGGWYTGNNTYQSGGNTVYLGNGGGGDWYTGNNLHAGNGWNNGWDNGRRHRNNSGRDILGGVIGGVLGGVAVGAITGAFNNNNRNTNDWGIEPKHERRVIPRNEALAPPSTNCNWTYATGSVYGKTMEGNFCVTANGEALLFEGKKGWLDLSQPPRRR